MSEGRPLATLVVVLLLVQPVRAQWEVIFLHPEGATASRVEACAGGLQGGRMTMPDGNDHPVLWRASLDQYTDLLPSWAWGGYVAGINSSCQVGTVYSLSGTHGALWHGSVDSLIVLTPPGYVYSYAGAAALAQQVGYAGYPGQGGGEHAVLWVGSAQEFVDLHPAPARWSQALATDGVLQGGWGSFPEPGELHAILWHGSADSFIDMNPAGARESRITGMAPGGQVGWGLFGTREFGVRWRGTPGSAVNMHPADGYTSRLYATCGRYHVGYVNYQGWAEAGVWTHDDPESFENLQPYLGEEWIVSAAYAVSIDNGRLYVGGSARRSGQREQAVLWVRNLLETRGAVGASSPISASPIPAP